MKVSAIILAGGRGARVQGRDKGLLEWRGRPQVAAITDILRPLAAEILISANRNQARYAAYGDRVIPDTLADFQGPLAGLAATLPQCRFDTVLVVPCDCPELPPGLPPALLAALQDGHTEVAYASDAERDHYLLAALRRELAVPLASFLAGGGRAVRDWFAGLEVRRVPAGVEHLLNRNR